MPRTALLLLAVLLCGCAESKPPAPVRVTWYPPNGGEPIVWHPQVKYGQTPQLYEGCLIWQYPDGSDRHVVSGSFVYEEVE